MTDTVKIFDLRGMPLLGRYFCITKPTPCVFCGCEVVVVRVNLKLELILVNEKDYIDFTGSGRKSNLHEARCISRPMGKETFEND